MAPTGRSGAAVVVSPPPRARSRISPDGSAGFDRSQKLRKRALGTVLGLGLLLFTLPAGRGLAQVLAVDDFEWGSTCAWSNDLWSVDQDDDGYGDAQDPGSPADCPPPVGTVSNNLDCDDADGAVHPLAAEACNGVDDDCDGDPDAADGGLILPACENQNGVCSGAVKPASRCVAGGWETCASADYAQHSGSYEGTETTCDGLDNDCDQQVDEDCPPGPWRLRTEIPRDSSIQRKLDARSKLGASR